MSIECTIPNVKGEEYPNIVIVYGGNSEAIEGAVYLRNGTQTGHFKAKFSSERMFIKDYFPIGNFNNPNIIEFARQGISRTFLSWLSLFSKINGIEEIYVESTNIINVPIWFKYFGSKIKTNKYNDSWEELEKLKEGFYGTKNFPRGVLIADPIDYDNSYLAELEHQKGLFYIVKKTIRSESWPDLQTDDIVEVDNNGLIYHNKKLIKTVHSIPGELAMSGAPKNWHTGIDHKIRETTLPNGTQLRYLTD